LGPAAEGGGFCASGSFQGVPRKPRAEVAGGVFHVYARGNDRGVIYRDDSDRRMYLRMLRGTVRQQRWRLLAYCLMENHVHLVMETPHANLAGGMQRMHGLYAREFNTRHRRSGHLFQGRYGAVPIKTDEQLVGAAVYVAMNPVEAGLCSRPDEWPWSSHAAVIDGMWSDWIDVPRLLGIFGRDADEGRRRYAALFE
jgi:putative transposase